MSALLFLVSLAIIVVAGSNPSSPPFEFDCAARKFAWEFGLSKLRWATYNSAAVHIFDALRLHECHEPRLDVVRTASRNLMAEPETTINKNNNTTSCSKCIFVDATLGNDSSGDGSIHAPLQTLVAARNAARKLRNNSTIVLRGGRYCLEDTLVLDHRDSGLTIMAFEKEHVVISGGDLIRVRLFPTKQDVNIYSAHLDKRHYEFTLLFRVHDNKTDDERLVWAREPNGHPERDLQPDGYARVTGRGTAGTWPKTRGIHVAVTEPTRNSSIYPVFGQDLDPRGGGHWFHIGDERFADNKGFWNGTIMTGMRYNSTSGFNCSNWTRDGYRDAVAHVFHNALWGNWQFRIQSIKTKTEQIDFNASGMVHGGWQEGRGGRMGTQPFFVEGVWQALDVPGEWSLNRTSQTLYYYPHANETATLVENDGALPLEFVAPRLKRLVAIMGQTSSAPATNISIRGVTFAHSATCFLDKYEVPSPGDWSIRREGALFLENAKDINVDLCRFVRTGGNAIFLSGQVKQASLTRNEFAWIGNSAVVTVGRIPMNNGYSVRTYPEDTRIANNHFREIGIHGKQTSAIFSALSCRTLITGNVAYNGPRAGINLNDGFCHGHRIEENLLFNWVRETQDHGPINTWNRALYIQRNTTNGEPTVTPEWTHVSRNFIMNGPSGNRDLGNLFPAIDNDDGSSFFVMSNNFLVYGGVKNYLGHTKTWSRNLIAYPGKWSGDPCAQLWGGPNHIFEGNTCIVGYRQRPLGLDGTIKGDFCIIDWDDPGNTENVAWSFNNTYFLDDTTAWWFSCGNGTALSHRFTLAEMQLNGREVDSSLRNVASLSMDAIIALARQTLHHKKR